MVDSLSVCFNKLKVSCNAILKLMLSYAKPIQVIAANKFKRENQHVDLVGLIYKKKLLNTEIP